MKFLRLALLTAAAFPAAARAATPGTPAATTTAPSETREEALIRENRQLAADLTRAQDSVREAQAALAKQSAEIATVRADSAAGRIQLTKVQSELAATRSSLASQGPDPGGALERERTAHLATKATLAQRESQVHDLITSRDKIESENRVLQASTATAKSLPGAESPSTLAQNAELNAKVATLTRELASARSEVATLRQELRNQTNKAATDSETHSRQVAALQENLTLAHNELIQARTSLDATVRSTASDVAALEQELSATRSQLGPTKSALEAANQSAAASHTSKTETETQLARLHADSAALQRDLETAQRNAAEAQRRLNAARAEIEVLRVQTAAAQDLEKRVHQLEAEKADRDTRPREPADRDELDRAIAARASAEDKLATVLRAYTLLARERDELRTQVAALSTKKSEPPALPASAPIPVTFAETPVTPAELEPAPQPAPVRPTPASGTTTSTVSPRVVSYQPTPPPLPRPTFQAARPVVPPGQPAFSHLITAGETLASISRRYYGNPARWPEIVAANRDVLPDQRSFAAGRMLRIP